MQVWSSRDGTPGSVTYYNVANASLVPADQDFSGCLELLKTSGTQLLRYACKTPISPERYLKISARVKVILGNFPAVRIAGWACNADDTHLPGMTGIGSLVQLDNYGKVIEISAIVGSG